jgi:hypothetical protein
MGSGLLVMGGGIIKGDSGSCLVRVIPRAELGDSVEG